MDRAVAWAAGTLVALVGYAGRLWVRNGAGPLVWNDSADYLVAAGAPLLSLDRLAGGRPVLLPLVLSAVGSDLDRLATMQAAVAALSWGLLCVAAVRTVVPWWRVALVSVAIAALSLSWPLSMWDQQVLTESLAISTLVLLSAAAVSFARRPGQPWPSAALVVAALGWLLARDSHVVPVAMAGGALVIVGWRAPSPRRVAMVLAGAYLLAWSLLIVGSAQHGDRQRLPIEHVYAVRILPYEDRVQWMAERGMPDAELFATRTATSGVDTSHAPVSALGGQELERWRSWLGRSGRQMLARYVLAHPGYLVSEPMRSPERVFNNAGGIEGYRPLAQRDLPGSAGWANPPTILVVVAGAIAAAVAAARRVLGQPLALVGAVLVLTAGPHALVVWHADGMEAARHLLMPSIGLRLGVLLMVLGAITGTAPCPPARSPARPRVRRLPAA